MFSSSIQTAGDNQDVPDYVYYNADIINNETRDLASGSVFRDPEIRFNETRDTAIIKNAADYLFSIIRFTMDGANKDLPLFIPNIATGTGQTNVNLTTYGMAVTFSQVINYDGVADRLITGIPSTRYIQFDSETKNPFLAPAPRTLANPNFKGAWGAGTQYYLNDVVSITGADVYGSFAGPFYQVSSQVQWSVSQQYPTNSLVQYNYNVYLYTGSSPSTLGVPPTTGGSGWVLAPTVGTNPTQNSAVWNRFSDNAGNNQDLSSRYYWVYTYQHMVDLWNKTMLDETQFGDNVSQTSKCAYYDTYVAFYNNYVALKGDGLLFPYPTFGDFCNASYPPVMKFVTDTSKFDIYLDSAGFGTRLTAFTATTYSAGVNVGIITKPVCRLFFNSNMTGLFGNYDNIYWNLNATTQIPFVVNGTTTNYTVPTGYTNEILATNKAFQNVSDFRLVPYTGVAPLGYSPVTDDGKPITPNMINRVYYLAQQDYSSTDSLWSPISSIVFTSTLLPIKAEATGQPVVLGASNVGISTATVQSAFQPIITDISLDTSIGNADSYRRFIYYAPSAEYRLSDFSSSKQDIRNIDIQVFWKNRLDNQLYPINMYNLSNVSIKVMFKHKDAQ